MWQVRSRRRTGSIWATLSGSPWATLDTASAPGERIEHALAEAATPLTRRALRRLCRVRASTLGPVLARLLADGRVTRSAAGYQLAPS
jgi:hypothetical protein